MKRLVAHIAFLLVVICSANAATITAANSGGWYTNSTWSCNCQPAASDNVVIPAGITVTITSGPVILSSLTIITVTINGTLSLVSGGTLIVDANDIVKVASGGKVTGTGPLDAVWSGATPVWVPNGTSINGPSSITAGSLPITLLFFKGQAESNVVKLEWASAVEHNLDHYVIARSRDGVNFERIASVKGLGNTVERQDYSYEDTDPLPGVSYYTLESVDLDFSSQAFDIIHIDWSGPIRKHEVNVYPNPVVDGVVHVKLSYHPEIGGSVAIFDGQGRQIAERPTEPAETTYDLELPAGSGRGIYFATVRSGEETLRTTVVVH